LAGGGAFAERSLPASFVEDLPRFGRIRASTICIVRLVSTGESRIVNVAMAPCNPQVQRGGAAVIMDDITRGSNSKSSSPKPTNFFDRTAGRCVAHEVNTPLAVSPPTHRCCEAVAVDPQKAGLLEKSPSRLSVPRRSHNLLNFSRHGTELTEISLNKVIADTLALLEHQSKWLTSSAVGRL